MCQQPLYIDLLAAYHALCAGQKRCFGRQARAYGIDGADHDMRHIAAQRVQGRGAQALCLLIQYPYLAQVHRARGQQLDAFPQRNRQRLVQLLRGKITGAHHKNTVPERFKQRQQQRYFSVFRHAKKREGLFSPPYRAYKPFVHSAVDERRKWGKCLTSQSVRHEIPLLWV